MFIHDLLFSAALDVTCNDPNIFYTYFVQLSGFW